MVRRASMELGLEGTLSIMERRPSQETPSKSKSAPARSRVTPARKPSLTRRSSEIRKDLLPPGIAGDVVGAMLGCVAAVQKCMPAPPTPPPPSPRLARQPSAPATVAIPASAPATPRGATPSRESAPAPSPKRKPSNGSAAASLKAATAAAGVLARQRWKKAQLTVVAARGFGGGRFNQTLVRDPSSGRIVHAPEGGAPAAAETPKEEAERLAKLNDDEVKELARIDATVLTKYRMPDGRLGVACVMDGRIRGGTSGVAADKCLERMGISNRSTMTPAEIVALTVAVQLCEGMSPVRLAPADANAWVRRVKAAVTPIRELDPDPSPALLAPGLYLGSMAHASDVPLMKRLGLTHVLDCADREPIEAYDAAGVEHLLLGAQDNTSYPLLKTHSAQAAAFLRPALDGGGAVLIHCEQGINRSAAIAIAFLLEWRMEPLLDVVAHAFAARPIILQNQGFVTQLVEHAAALGLLEVDPAVAARRAERQRDPAAHRAAVIAQLGKV